MRKPSGLLVTLMELKKFQEMAFYDLLLSAECDAVPEIVRTGS